MLATCADKLQQLAQFIDTDSSKQPHILMTHFTCKVPRLAALEFNTQELDLPGTAALLRSLRFQIQRLQHRSQWDSELRRTEFRVKLIM